MSHQNIKQHLKWPWSWFLGVIFLTGQATCQKPILTNLELFSTLSGKLADSSMFLIGIQPGDSVNVVENQNASDISKLIIQSIAEDFFKKGITIFSRMDSTIKGIDISIIVTKAWIGYEGSYRRSFLGPRWIIRFGEVHIFLRAMDPMSGQIVWTGNLKTSRRDSIPEAALDLVEQKGQIIGKPRRPAVHGIWKWVEPLIIAGAMGSTVLLFYSVRSQ